MKIKNKKLLTCLIVAIVALSAFIITVYAVLGLPGTGFKSFNGKKVPIFSLTKINHPTRGRIYLPNLLYRRAICVSSKSAPLPKYKFYCKKPAKALEMIILDDKDASGNYYICAFVVTDSGDWEYVDYSWAYDKY